ncbi:MAG: class I SAM-dependent methyltransferase [Caulobacteraceae bacterium]|nr:class I SAM-dependent methyltransferase [Caulobacter sp.]
MPLEPPPLARRLASALSPPVRRALAGLWLDLTGLPARLADPERRGEPWQVLHNVGGGDYRATGEGVMRLLRRHAGLTADSRVLDIGCGTGRVAAHLAEALSPQGAYTGFDVSLRAVGGCRRRFASTRPDFRFAHLDLANGEYNEAGGAAETTARFPVDDGTVDVAFATSVFSHMRLPAIEAYLREAERTLSSAGRLLFTAYALTPLRREHSSLQAFGACSQVLDRGSPERMIAHDESALASAISRAGLQLIHRDLGAWARGSTYGDRQDLFVVARA